MIVLWICPYYKDNKKVCYNRKKKKTHRPQDDLVDGVRVGQELEEGARDPLHQHLKERNKKVTFLLAFIF